jgi:hypothetical protein
MGFWQQVEVGVNSINQQLLELQSTKHTTFTFYSRPTPKATDPITEFCGRIQHS